MKRAKVHDKVWMYSRGRYRAACRNDFAPNLLVTKREDGQGVDCLRCLRLRKGGKRRE